MTTDGIVQLSKMGFIHRSIEQLYELYENWVGEISCAPNRVYWAMYAVGEKENPL